jgi:hypothetical protein
MTRRNFLIRRIITMPAVRMPIKSSRINTLIQELKRGTPDFLAFAKDFANYARCPIEL